MQKRHGYEKCQRAAIILANGDDNHRDAPVEFATSDSVPEQFCTPAQDRVLLEQTVSSVARLVPLKRAAIVVNRAHRGFYAETGRVPSSSIVVQPANRGTVPGILYGLRRLSHVQRHTTVAVFPCVPFFKGSDRLTRHVEQAMVTVEASPALSVVMGIVPTSSQSPEGWIEPGEHACPIDPSIFFVRHFWRKPPPDLAAKLMLEGCLWNSLIIVASASRLLEMIAECVPSLYIAFNTAFASLSDDRESIVLDRLYSSMETYEFSREVLSRCPAGLAVKRIDDLEVDELIGSANLYNSTTNIKKQSRAFSVLPVAALPGAR
jgi:mannose-1-phosphate guanylyltransferase